MRAAANPVGSFTDVHEARLGQTEFVEDALVEQLKAGSEMAFRRFVEQYQSKVCRVTFGILGNRRDAEDVAQNVFAKIYFSIKDFNGSVSLNTWVHRVAVDECHSVVRRRRQKTFQEANTADHSISAPMQQRNLINKLLERIPEFDRQLLLLREVEGCSVADIAQATGLNQKIIRARLFQARQRLSKGAAQISLRARRTADDNL
jgi:RNA polymerase sigma-70 factor (ECF subfamily)